MQQFSIQTHTHSHTHTYINVICMYHTYIHISHDIFIKKLSLYKKIIRGAILKICFVFKYVQNMNFNIA